MAQGLPYKYVHGSNFYMSKAFENDIFAYQLNKSYFYDVGLCSH